MKSFTLGIWICSIMASSANAQNVGIGTTTPAARLHVADSSVVFTGINDNILYPAIPPPVQGPGIRMLWYPEKAAFRAGFAGFNTWDRDNIGTHSFAGGQGTLAKGRSTTAFGIVAEAIGDYSTATGIYTRTRALGSIVMGAYNNIADNPNPNAMMPEDRILQIGNGSNEEQRSNALTVLRNGNMGLGTTNPTAGLHVHNKAVLFEGTSLDNTTLPPASGSGARMMWLPERAAFRAGYLINDFSTWWNRDSIGKFSFAVGQDVKAKLDYSIAMGGGSQALEYGSVAIGLQSVASGIQSVSIGGFNLASGNNSIALGRFTKASGQHSTAFGYETIASAPTATSMGYKTKASNNDATSMGYQTEASGGASTSMGAGTTAKAYGSISMGMYNDNVDAPNGGSPQPADRLFQIGNGTNAQRSNALTILRNANTGVGVTDPFYTLDLASRMRIRGAPGFTAGIWLNNEGNTGVPAFVGMRSDEEVGIYGQTGASNWRFYVNTSTGNAFLQGSLTQNSDARLKKDIVPISNTLEALQQINGYTYSWKDPSNPDEQVGLLAQELQKVYPQLVKENGDGNLGVNYAGMIPVLLQAIKELKLEVDALKKQLKK